MVMKKYGKLILGILFLSFGIYGVIKEDINDVIVFLSGLGLICYSIYKLFFNLSKANTKILKRISIIEFVLVILLGIGTVIKYQEGDIIKYTMGLGLFLSSLSYLWQLNYRSGKLNNSNFFTNIVLMTIGSNLFLSDYTTDKFRQHICYSLIIIGGVLLLYFIIKTLVMKKVKKG